MHRSIPTHPTSILLIEPARGPAMRLQEGLLAQQEGPLDIGVARTLREGLTHLRTHHVDLVLMNLTLPDDKGLDAVRALRLAAPTCALIALSAVPDETLFLDALCAGAHEVLAVASPSASELRITVERALVRARRGASETQSASRSSAAGACASPRVIHDLNNVLTSINGFADILLARLPSEDPARSCAEQIRHAGTRAAALVKSLEGQPDSARAVSTPAASVIAQAT